MKRNYPYALDPSDPLPETAPSNIVLTEVFHACGLNEEFVDLVTDVEFLMVLEITASQLLLHSGKNLKCSGILHLLRFIRNLGI